MLRGKVLADLAMYLLTRILIPVTLFVFTFLFLGGFPLSHLEDSFCNLTFTN